MGHPNYFGNTPCLNKVRDQQKMRLTGLVCLPDQGKPVKFRNVSGV